ncbi:Gfo/Idh/MocA family protein [Variovorax terrae]|uniref:Gfo/Idh/MocA family oxidoreductase n=1 Tax=Variovorax terrae TaxID=2923278 RepID=A0A9X1VW15_9BURK|nr:Gfo/Idh/MocA family oxidoreductase [Variovorax terrae]MCJ0764274.1 Gfo/Idh/MocA family oxidoreductase [Variovorax terrae]
MSSATAKLKVLLIGCGNIAGGFDTDAAPGTPPRTHAGAYLAHGGFSLEACIEPDTAKREAFMQRWNVARGHADIAGAIGTEFDVISICSPTTAHHHDTLAALALRPRLVFCEKPICANLAQAEDLVQRCTAQDVLLAVNHNRRWDPEIVRLREELASGAWGALRSVSCHYNKGVLNNGSHMIDLLHDLLGSLELQHVGAPLADYWRDDPTVPALLRTRDGAEVSLNAGHAADYSLFEIQLVTEHAVIAMEDGGMRWRLRLAAPSPHFPGYRALPEGSIRPGGYLHTMSNAVANLHGALHAGAALASTGDSALAAQRVCERLRSASLESASLHTSRGTGTS